MAGAKIGTFDDLLDLTEPLLRETMITLRALILEVHPNAVEVVRLGDRAATYGTGPRKMLDGYAYLMPHKNWINLGFYQGVDLPDPDKLLDGTGAKLRHVKIQSVDKELSDRLEALVAAALNNRLQQG